MAAAQASDASGGPASWTESFPWKRVPTMAWTSMWGPFVRKNMTGTGRFDDKVVRFLAENYELIVANGVEPGPKVSLILIVRSICTLKMEFSEQGHPNGVCQETKLKDFADRVAKFNPKAKVIMYLLR